jgi:hypothetical protein
MNKTKAIITENALSGRVTVREGSNEDGFFVSLDNLGFVLDYFFPDDWFLTKVSACANVRRRFQKKRMLLKRQLKELDQKQRRVLSDIGLLEL